MALCALIFYGLGNTARRLLVEQDPVGAMKQRPWAGLLGWALCFGLVLLGSGWNGHVTMAQGIYGRSPVLFYGLAVLGIGSVLFFSLLLEAWPDRLPWVHPLLSGLAWFGKNSLYVMAVHVPIMMTALALISRCTGLPAEALRYSYRYTLPIFGIMLLGSCLLTVGNLFLKRKLKNA